jgi:hypothetical protein
LQFNNLSNYTVVTTITLQVVVSGCAYVASLPLLMWFFAFAWQGV